MGQFIPHAPLRGAAPQHHRQHKPQHAQRRKMPHSPSFLLTRRALLGTVPQQLRRIDGLEHTQTYLLAHLVTLLQVRYSIHIGFFLSACCMDLLSLQYVSKAPLLSALALLSSYLKCIGRKAFLSRTRAITSTALSRSRMPVLRTRSYRCGSLG